MKTFFGVLTFCFLLTNMWSCKSSKPIDDGAAQRAKQLEQLEKDKKAFEQKNKSDLGK